MINQNNNTSIFSYTSLSFFLFFIFKLFILIFRIFDIFRISIRINNFNFNILFGG